MFWLYQSFIIQYMVAFFLCPAIYSCFKSYFCQKVYRYTNQFPIPLNQDIYYASLIIINYAKTNRTLKIQYFQHFHNFQITIFIPPAELTTKSHILFILAAVLFTSHAQKLLIFYIFRYSQANHSNVTEL